MVSLPERHNIFVKCLRQLILQTKIFDLMCEATTHMGNCLEKMAC